MKGLNIKVLLIYNKQSLIIFLFLYRLSKTKYFFRLNILGLHIKTNY